MERVRVEVYIHMYVRVCVYVYIYMCIYISIFIPEIEGMERVGVEIALRIEDKMLSNLYQRFL
jgi:hypothetical protein